MLMNCVMAQVKIDKVINHIKLYFCSPFPVSGRRVNILLFSSIQVSGSSGKGLEPIIFISCLIVYGETVARIMQVIPDNRRSHLATGTFPLDPVSSDSACLAQS